MSWLISFVFAYEESKNYKMKKVLPRMGPNPTLTLPDPWFRPSVWGLAYAQVVETGFPKLVMSLLVLHLEYPQYFLDFTPY